MGDARTETSCRSRSASRSFPCASAHASAAHRWCASLAASLAAAAASRWPKAVSRSSRSARRCAAAAAWRGADGDGSSQQKADSGRPRETEKAVLWGGSGRASVLEAACRPAACLEAAASASRSAVSLAARASAVAPRSCSAASRSAAALSLAMPRR